MFTSLRYVSNRTSASITGPDLSNNTPIYSHGAWQAIARHSRFAYLKSVEGTGFTDSTAGPMARQARSVGVPAGGYDFLHVCQVNPISEGAHYIAALRGQGLLILPGTLAPAGDAEYPFGSLGCNARVWMQSWVDEVYHQDGHVCPILYTGAWWWQPHIGSWWPTCHGVQLRSWISGYNVRYPYMPAGIAHLEIWQFSDRGYNGYNNSDLSVWHGSAASFASFASGRVAKPKAKRGPYGVLAARRIRLAHGILASERTTVQTWDRSRCANPARRAVCVTSRAHLVLLRDRIDYVAHHPLRHHKPTYGLYRRGARRAIIEKRLHAQ